MTQARQFHLVRRPRGIPVAEDFALVEATVPDIGEGEVEVENLILSVDPYMRPRLNADQPLGAPMLGGGIGRIVGSRNPKFNNGDLVRHGGGFQDRFVSDGKGLLGFDPFVKLVDWLEEEAAATVVHREPAMAVHGLL